MNSKKNKAEPGKAQNIDGYIAGFPPEVRAILEQVRTVIKNTAPEAEEKISYGMPAFTYHGILVYFAAYAKHVGFYATPTGHEQFEKELSNYKQGKGSVQFPLERPIPYELIAKIVSFRIKENLAKSKKKR